MTGSEHMLHAGGKASALSSFSLEEQKEIEQSPQRWCGGSEAQRTPLWSWESASEHTQHSTDAIAGEEKEARARGANLRFGREPSGRQLTKLTHVVYRAVQSDRRIRLKYLLVLIRPHLFG